ncbi:unnamed protein product [Leptidea sinapis]|uniref:F-box domain-containing protein n=1 Tax=Leptidea sinapis TaxID=189913 RepID=A0A5E4PRL3_9NEOP|nr:unnamed protein product [Leptidea sinapis]
MDMHSELAEPLTPGLSYGNNSNYWKNEDSGYHTPYTPGSFECSETSNDGSASGLLKGNICIRGPFHVDCYSFSTDVNILPRSKYNCSNLNDSFKESPQIRRGVKRSYQEDIENSDLGYSTVPTPTTLIAGGLRKLKFNECSKIKGSGLGHTESINELYHFNDQVHTFPSTPIKRTCRTSCKLSSPSSLKRPAKKLSFVMHSLTCESHALQNVSKIPKAHSKAVKSIQFRPEQKFDIIKMLYEKANVMPPIMKIFSYLSNEDIFNFTLVSPVWLRVWEDVSRIKTKKIEYLRFLKTAKENQENKGINTPNPTNSSQSRPLIEIHNVLNNSNIQKNLSSSPPSTPRTISQPAKVTEESSGEEWVECTSATCAYQYCKLCKCERHPGKNCILYDLDGPSPSKRKKSTSTIGTKKSKRNLRRLL